MEDKIYIDALYKDRKEVSELGAKWDATIKNWYYTNPKDAEKFSKWNKIELELPRISVLGYYKDSLNKEYIHFSEKGIEKITDGQEIYDSDNLKNILIHSEKIDKINIQDMLIKLNSNTIFTSTPLEQLIPLIQPKIYIDAPYQDRKEVSELGAKWDSTAKHWYYTNSDENEIFSKWNIIDIANTTDSLTSLVNQLEDGVRSIFESDTFKKYLYTASKFYNYSFRNQLLISMQSETASHVKGYSSWKKDFGMVVKKGEKGIQIVAPMMSSKKPDNIIRDLDKKGMLKIGSYQLQKTAFNTYNIYTTNSTLVNLDKDQFRVELIRIIDSNTLIGFQPVYVFDISQVVPELIQDEHGNTIPNPKAELFTTTLLGEVSKYNPELTLNLFHAFKNICKVPIKEEKIQKPGVKGIFSRKTMDITLEESLDIYDKTSCLIHEIAHGRLHDTQEKINTKTRSTKEVEAESVAFIVSKHYGFNTDDLSFPYIATWSKNKELTDLESSLKIIQQESQKIITELDNEMQHLHEKSIENSKSLKEQHEEVPETVIETEPFLKNENEKKKIPEEIGQEQEETFKQFKNLYNKNRFLALSELCKYGNKQFHSLTQTELKILANSNISNNFILNSLDNCKPIDLEKLYEIVLEHKVIESPILVEVISCEDICDKNFFNSGEIINFEDANKRLTEYETFVESFKAHSESYFPDIHCDLNIICINPEFDFVSSCNLQVSIGDGKQTNLIDSIKKSNFLKKLQKENSKSGIAAKQFIKSIEKTITKERSLPKQKVGVSK